MLLELLSKIFRQNSNQESTPKSLEQSGSFASLPVLLQESLDNPTWTKKAISQLRRHEGEVLYAYQDHLGFWTIGIGRLIDKRKNGGISKDEAEYLLSNDVAKVLRELTARLPWFDKLSEPRRAVLLNMGFQLGIGGLMGFSRTLGLIEAGNYAEAADQMLQSKWAQQTPKRAGEMAEQMRTGKWQSG
jgi:lysozyme